MGPSTSSQVAPGDDQVVRIWDVRSGDCQQELRGSHWGQVTALNVLDAPSGKPEALLIGTAWGLVSLYPWHTRTQQFNRQAAIDTFVFPEVPVESQAIDSVKSRLVVASNLGSVKMYTIQDRKRLVLTWAFSIGSSIPRSIEFIGDLNETVVIHTYHYNSDTGKSIADPQKLRGGVGFVAFSSNKQQKAVHNLNTNRYDLYIPSDSTTPFAISPSGKSRKIKGASFGEGAKAVVCGGDQGIVYVYNIQKQEIEQELEQQGETCSTRDYHFIASGAGGYPGLIYIWSKPSDRKEAEDKEQELERQRSEAKAAEDAAAEARSKKEAELDDAEAAAQYAVLQELRREVNHIRTQKLLLRSFMIVILLVFCGRWLTKDAKNGQDTFMQIEAPVVLKNVSTSLINCAYRVSATKTKVIQNVQKLPSYVLLKSALGEFIPTPSDWPSSSAMRSKWWAAKRPTALLLP
ncbi:hypothetical protein B0H12DRAFT_1077774 [Mycena haematopus]|nr:hypothetical protein B0H12DRAFT_1077774 [Mycena haematopus]